MAWRADYPDPEAILQLFYSKNISNGGNESGYSNPQFDELYEKALTARDASSRDSLYADMAKLLAEDCPWIWGVHRIHFKLSHPWLKNYIPHEFDPGAAKYLKSVK